MNTSFKELYQFALFEQKFIRHHLSSKTIILLLLLFFEPLFAERTNDTFSLGS
jgi:hypothetical protein